MLAESGPDKLDRELIAVAVLSINTCDHCRTADPDAKQYAMLDYTVPVTGGVVPIEEKGRQKLRDTGYSDRDIRDIAVVASLFNLTNRMAPATDMLPVSEYYAMAR